jgi:hypothetical protein
VLVDLCFALDCHLSDLVTLEITDVKPHLVVPLPIRRGVARRLDTLPIPPAGGF